MFFQRRNEKAISSAAADASCSGVCNITISHRLGVQQDRQYTYNVTSKRVPATSVAVEKQYMLLILRACL